jgi:hypothetical protein
MAGCRIQHALPERMVGTVKKMAVNDINLIIISRTVSLYELYKLFKPLKYDNLKMLSNFVLKCKSLATLFTHVPASLGVGNQQSRHLIHQVTQLIFAFPFICGHGFDTGRVSQII